VSIKGPGGDHTLQLKFMSKAVKYLSSEKEVNDEKELRNYWPLSII